MGFFHCFSPVLAPPGPVFGVAFLIRIPLSDTIPAPKRGIFIYFLGYFTKAVLAILPAL